jgi:UDP-N-acetyl-D-glucosamine dehydrogenase
MTIGIVGLGHVGLPLAVAFAEAGEQVLGLDADARRVAALRRGESHIEDVGADALRAVGHRLEPTSRAATLAQADAIVICVPTPLTPNREPDLAPLTDAAQTIATVLRPGQLVVVESTIYPGATRDRVLPILEESGLAVGEDFFLGFSPARVDPGSEEHTLRTTPKLVSGLTDACAERVEELYGLVCDQLVRVSVPEVAEMAKLLENVFRSVNMALVNELAELADRLGIDVREVVDAAATKPFGFMRFDPGPGMGGHCLPVDPFYLGWKAREVDFAAEFIELAGKVNQHAPSFAVEKIVRTLNDLGRPVRGARIALFGVSYKAGVGDIRESPAMKIIGRLGRLGAAITYHDAYVPSLRAFGLQSSSLEDALRGADLAVIVTAHPGVDHHEVARRVPTVDLRGVTRERLTQARPVARLRPIDAEAA